MKSLLASLALTLLMLAGAANAQDAKVIALDAADAAEAHRLHDAKVAADKALADFTETIRKKYTTREVTYPSCGSGLISQYGCVNGNPQKGTEPIPGWEYQFVFSEDWKFIVPKPLVETRPNPINGCVIPTSTGSFIYDERVVH